MYIGLLLASFWKKCAFQRIRLITHSVLSITVVAKIFMIELEYSSVSKIYVLHVTNQPNLTGFTCYKPAKSNGFYMLQTSQI